MKDKEPKHWCKFLRWKSYGVDQSEPLQVAKIFCDGSVTYTCLHTGLPLGPDDNLAAPEKCQGARSCYRHHPMHDRTTV